MDFELLARAFPPRRPVRMAPPRVLYCSRTYKVAGTAVLETVTTELCVGARGAWLKVLGTPASPFQSFLRSWLSSLGFTAADEPGTLARWYESKAALAEDVTRLRRVLSSVARAGFG
jgi:hypothetical protein